MSMMVHDLDCFSKTTMSGLLWSILWSVSILKSHSILVSLWFLNRLRRVVTPLWALIKAISFTQLPVNDMRYLIVYCFWASILHSAVMWLMVSSLSPHSPHIGEMLRLTIVALTLLVLRAWSWAAITRPSVSFFSFLSFFPSYHYYTFIIIMLLLLLLLLF